ncbi:MAG TPA: hypothetical protein VNO21_08690, partial [Polyangiaceae bacterium]|nr:hypothetical protein [Polyangiaceae bacterium]
FERKIVLRTAHFMVAATVVAQSDLIATLPERVARFCAKRLSLRLLATPLPMTFASAKCGTSGRTTTLPTSGFAN